MEKLNDIPDSVEDLINTVEDYFSDTPTIGRVFRNCYSNTLQKTMFRTGVDTVFIITGDIPAMWLRDSAAQVKPYLPLAKKDTKVAELIGGVIKRQFNSMLIDPYANAFNVSANNKGHQSDETKMHPAVWERKYEVDSLCYPIQLAYLYWKATGNTDIFLENRNIKKACKKVINLWEREQNHENRSKYRFQRPGLKIKLFSPTDTLKRKGKGRKTSYTGMTWSGFRPSDDACTYHYLIPSQMFAVVVLGYLEEILTQIIPDEKMVKKTKKLREEIQDGIEKYGIIYHEKFGNMYAYEVDGRGNYLLMDDANVPSLLSAPYLGYCSIDDEIYQNTRKFILSSHNPFYFEGEIAKGVGSPHTTPSKNRIWHIALAIEGLTSKEKEEKLSLIQMMVDTDAGKEVMHESFDVNNPKKFSREWFSWANAMFCELVLDYLNLNSI